jgi:dienelactone hydrolase
MTGLHLLTALLISFSSLVPASEQGKLPESDMRTREVRTLDTRREFPEIPSKAAWETRAREIREHVLVSCGLWPMPEKTPLNPKIFDRVERDGYTIEKVYIQTLPRFYLAGNLYRPLGKGAGPFPGVLNPHGHWKEGRFANAELGSIAARCINFARQGMVAFSYDMVGYNDTAQVNHKFAADPTNLLWNISLMGLQTWNSIRALDFLESLPGVDKSRLACTGESGGGTQTFMLGAVDNRLHAQAPIVMVSHSMQGGCLCENAPGLRVDYSNMEIAAVPAPRPQILVAATGDWTKMTMTVEGPAIERIYKLFNAPDKLRYTIFNFDHNYNQTTREAVYGWFGKWLLDKGDGKTAVKETPYQMDSVESLRVFPGGKLPEDALNEPQLIAYLIDRSRAQLDALRPKDASGLEQFKARMLPAWRHTLQAEFPEHNLIVETGESKKSGAITRHSLHIGRRDRGDRLPLVMLTPAKDNLRVITILAHPDGKAAYLDGEGLPRGTAKELLERNQSVILLDSFLTGDLANAAADKRKYTTGHFSTYNRTDLQERVQDLITACAFAHSHGKGRHVVLSGSGRAGLWALLAAPAADAVIADAVALDPQSGKELMGQDLFAPGLLKIGSFEGAALLAAPNPLFLHNTAESFSTAGLDQAYRGSNKQAALRHESKPAGDAAQATWIAQLKFQ